MGRPPARADRYQRLRHLGEGASGSVWLVEDSASPGSRLALKELTEQARGKEDVLRREFATLSALHHPNFVEVLEFDVSPETDLPRFTMEFVDGDDIVAAVRKGGPVTFFEVACESLRALAFLHDFGLIHRDLKPANVLVRRRPARSAKVVMLDFGLVAQLHDDQIGGVAGTLPYMAPELFEGASPGPTSDLYALAAVLFEAIHGVPLFDVPEDGNLAAFLEAVRSGGRSHAGVPAGYPPDLAAWFDGMLAVRPDDRPAKASEALALLGQAREIPFPLETPATLRSRLAFGGPPGRESEVHEIWRHLESSGGSHVLWICGGPGSGKTRILNWVHAEAVRLGREVLLRPQADRAVGVDHDRRGRRLMILDDAESMAAHVVSVVAHLLQQASAPDLDVIVALRPDEVSDAGLVALMRQSEFSPAMRRLDLAPLDASGLRAMVERATGTSASATQTRWLLDQSEGNALVATSLIIDEAWKKGTSASNAETLAGALSRQVRSVPSWSREWLEACCVLSEETEASLVSEVAAVDDALGQLAAAELQAMGLVKRGEVGWKPDSRALSRSVVESLAGPTLLTLHKRAANALLARFSDRRRSWRVAVHLAAAGEGRRASEFALLAAEQALEDNDTSTAADRFALAIRGVPRGDDTRYRLRFRQGEALIAAGRNPEAVRAFGAAGACARTSEQRAIARLRQARALINIGRIQRAQRVAEQVREQASTPGADLNAALSESLLGMVELRQGRHEQALALFAKAAARFSNFGPSDDFAECLHFLGWLESRLGRSSATDHLQEALEMSRSQGDSTTHLKVLYSLSTHFSRTGRHGDAQETADRLRELAEELRDPSAVRLAMTRLGRIAYQRGDYDRAASLSHEIEALGYRFGEPTSVFRARNLRADALIASGRPAEAADLMRRSLQDELLPRADQGMIDWLQVTLAEALSCLSENDAANAEQILADLIKPEAELDPVKDWRVRNLFLEWRVAQQDAEQVSNLATTLEQAPENDPHIVGFESKTRFHIAKARHLLQQGRYEEAELEAERAGELAGRGDQPSFGAVARGVAAEACERRGDERAAAQHLEQGRALLEQAALRIADSEMRRDFLARPLFRRLREEAGGTADARLLALYEMVGALGSERDIDRLLESILDMALKVVQAERGMILLLDPDDRSFSVRLVRNLEEETEKDAEAFSRSVIERAGSGESVLAVDAGRDDRFRSLRSVSLFGIRSLMCVPLRLRERIVGTVYLDSRSGGTVFTREDLRFVEAFADHAALALDNARELERLALENARLRREAESKVRFENIVGESPAMERVFALMSKVAASELPVLIQGESGTGKELVARAIHFHGPRRDSACLTENCAAIPETLLESELFGHVRGAFTGAERDRAGLFEEADGGTLFLDEIGDMSPAMQARLLRVLQEGEIRRVGGERPIAVDVRVIAASHRDLEQEVEAGRFREDLLYRLKVLVVRLPPLRERVGDIRLLVDFLLERIAAERGRERPRISVEVMERLERYRWPGNVRQLQNVLQRLALLAGSGPIDLALLETDRELGRLFDAGKRAAEPLYSLEANERERIRSALEQARGNRSRAARMLGISRATIYRKLKAYGLE